MIHPTAIIHPKAVLDPTASVGPYAVIDEFVTLGARCVVGPHVYLTGITAIANDNRFHTGCVIGDAPQDLKYRGEPSRLRIGEKNVFREYVTIHRSNKMSEDTVIGSENYLMANSHVGHNCILGNNIVMANGALLGGHATIADRAFISGNCLVHQFVRVGTLALMQGGSAISKDLPPYTVARGSNGICGLNIIGLRRAGLASEERLELKALYHLLFRSHRAMRGVLSEAHGKFKSPACQLLIEFVAGTKRGVCRGTNISESHEEA